MGLEVTWIQIRFRNQKDQNSGNVSYIEKFRMVQIFAYFKHVQRVRKLNPTKISAWGMCVQSAMAFDRYLKPLNEGPNPYEPLFSTVSPSSIKDANTAVKNVPNLLANQGEHTLSLLWRPKQPLQSMPRCTVLQMSL